LDNQKVTDRLVKDALLPFERCPFARQKGTFYNAKGALLECKRASIEMLMCIYYYKIGFLSPCYMVTLRI